MSQNRKYLGMTSAQIGILVGLGVAVCILIAVTAWLMFGGKVKLPFSRPPENTPTPQMTPTLFVIPTFTPTVTPTPIPYEQLIPNGWKQFKTTLVELWLPSSFKIADKDSDEELAISGANSSSSLYRMRVIVSYEPLTGDSLDAHLDAGLLKVDPQARLVERRKVSLNSTETVRMMFEMRVETVDVNQLVYVIQDGGTVWFIVYVAQINEFYDMLPIFEQSAKTFRVVR
jgi:hypothetical protein